MWCGKETAIDGSCGVTWRLGRISLFFRNTIINKNTVELQWLEHLWDHGNAFETWVVRATEGNHGTSSGSK